MSAHVIDVTDATFDSQILAESARRVVVVDFWAPWCGPCRALSPVLDRLAEQAGGRFLLAKVNTDDNPAFAGQLGVRGIPAVFALKDGRVIDSFVGALPEAQVRAFLDRVAPSPAEDAARALVAMLAEGAADPAKVERAVAAAEAVGRTDGRLAVARAWLAARGGRLGEARELLDDCDVPAAVAGPAAQVRALIDAGSGDARDLEATIAADPSAVQARIQLAGLRYAAGAPQAAFDVLLDGLARAKGGDRDALRKKLVSLFDAVGARDPIVEAARSRLAALWFS
jgi:putative thioredoxin